jgi:hypothetical protein
MHLTQEDQIGIEYITLSFQDYTHAVNVKVHRPHIHKLRLEVQMSL